MKSESISHIQPILFVFIHFGKVLFTLFDDYVTGCARTVSAAGVLQVKTAVKSDIQQRPFLSVFVIRRHPWFVLNRHWLAPGEKEIDFVNLPLRFSGLLFGDCADTRVSEFHAQPFATSDALRSLRAAIRALSIMISARCCEASSSSFTLSRIS